MILIIGGMAQGKLEYAKTNFDDSYEIINGFENKVKQWLSEGKHPEEEIRLMEFHEHQIIIATELGCGIVPMKKEDRIWREKSGRVNCYLASKATQVIRVMAGLGMRIK